MREIKFRAWDGERYHYMGNAAFILEYSGISTFDEYGDERTHQDWILEQYTGLPEMIK